MVSLQGLGGELRLSSCLETQTTPMGLEWLPGHPLAGASRCGPSLMPYFIPSCEEHGFSLQYFKTHHYKPGWKGCFLQQELGRKVFSLPSDSGGKWSMGNGFLRNLWEGAWWPAPPSQLFLPLCCSSNQSPQLKFQQVGLYHPEAGESRAVRGKRPAWSPSSVVICPSTTPHCHAPPCPLADCAGMCRNGFP